MTGSDVLHAAASAPDAETATVLPAQRLRIATATLDPQGRVVHWSRAAEEFTGYPASDIVGRDVGLLSDGTEQFWVPDIVAKLLRDGHTGKLRCRDGSVRGVECHAFPVPWEGGETGAMLLVLNTGDLMHAGTELPLLDALFHQAPFGVCVLDTDLRYLFVNDALAALGGRPAAEYIGRTTREACGGAGADAYEALLEGVLESGQAVAGLRVCAPHPERAQAPRSWSVSAYRLDDPDGRPFGIAAMIVDVTGQETVSREESRSRARLSLLNEASARVGTTLDLECTARELTDVAVPAFADFAAVDLLEEVVTGTRPIRESGAEAVLHRVAARCGLTHPAARVVAATDGPLRFPAHAAVARCLAGGRPVLLRDARPSSTGDGVARDSARAKAAEELGMRSFLVVPLRARGTMLGTVLFDRGRGRDRFDADDVRLGEELATRVAISIDNARMYRRERESVLALQRALLPTRLPEVPGAEIAYRYRPACDTAEAGGDWFDVIRLPGHRVGLVIGDVMGHGVEAAATMGRFRMAMHTLATVGLTPAALLTRLDELAAEMAGASLATCVYAVYDPLSGNCLVASAGHPPPVLVGPDGATELLDVPTGTPLGVGSATVYQAAAHHLEPGSLLLLYTDGLVESRSQDIDVGIAALRDSVGSPDDDLEVICDRVLDKHGSDCEDDVAMLLARLGTLPRQDPCRPPAVTKNRLRWSRRI